LDLASSAALCDNLSSPNFRSVMSLNITTAPTTFFVSLICVRTYFRRELRSVLAVKNLFRQAIALLILGQRRAALAELRFLRERK